MQLSVGTDDERSAALLIAAAEALLNVQSPTIPADFVAGLFDRVAPEDLVLYDGREIAALAERAWSHLAERTPGAPKLRIAIPEIGRSERLKHISVHRDRQRRHAVPVRFRDGRAGGAGRRGPAGGASRFHRHAAMRPAGSPASTAAGAAPGETRESFIHIHVDRIADEDRSAPN